MDYNIFKEFAKFNNIKFYEDPHVYFIDDEQVISVTGLIHKFTTEFEEEKWLKIKSEEKLIPSFFEPGESQEEGFERAKKILKAEWLYKNKHGIYEGKLIHKYLEYLMANKDVVEDKSGENVVTFSDIEKSFYMMKKLANDFYKEYIITGKLIPVKSELVVGSKDLKIAGQIDQLFFNTELNALQLFDWKTNKKMSRVSNYPMTNCLSHLDSCELNTYSLQLHTYKYLLEKNTNIRLHDKVNIVWFNEYNDKPRIIECKDMTKEVQMMFEFKDKNPDLFKVRPYIRPSIPVYEIEKVTAMEDLLNFNDPCLF